MNNNRQKIYINGRFLAQPKTGVQRFAEELLNELDRLIEAPAYAELEFICLVPRMKSQGKLPEWKNILIEQHSIFAGNLWEQAVLPYLARAGLLVNLSNISPLFHHAQIAVIHDASIFTMPDAYSIPFRLKYKLVYFALARSALRLLTVSQFSQKELSHFLHIPAEKIGVLPEGSEHILRVEADTSILNKYHLDTEPYFLAVGSASRHKNINAVIAAIEKSDDSLPKLALAGGVFSKVFIDEGSVSTIKFIRLGYVSDAQLRALYEHALAFVFPSLYEGFGLPPLEAMRCGCPVMVSDRASLPEVCGEAAVYFDPTNIDEIASNLQGLAGSRELRMKLREKGLARARQFTWEKTARGLLGVLVQEVSKK